MLKKKYQSQNKKVKWNNKYKNIKKTLNTGLTINDVIVLTDNQVTKKRNEIFKKISAKKLNEIILKNELSKSIVLNKSINEEEKRSNYFNYPIIDIRNRKEILNELDYFLVDLREKEEYEKFHIQDCNLNKHFRFLSNILIKIGSLLKSFIMFFKKKNRKNKFIILYSLNNKDIKEMANLLILKGFQNVLVLNGGVEKFTVLYPQLIKGYEIPQIKLPHKSLLIRKIKNFI